MADTDIPFEALHVLLLEDISDQAIAFAQVQFMAIAGNHARSVLPAVLQNSQSVVNLLIYRTTGDDADDATHNLCPLLKSIVHILRCARAALAIEHFPHPIKQASNVILEGEKFPLQ